MSDKEIKVKVVNDFWFIFAIIWLCSMILNKCTIEGKKYPSTIAVLGAEYEAMKTDFEKGREIFKEKK